jgi:hypothetical protein
MTASIPLRAALRVEMIQIIVGYSWSQGCDGMLESLAAESWCLRDIERETRMVS